MPLNNPDHIKYLLEQYITGAASPEELAALSAILKEDIHDDAIRSLISQMASASAPDPEYDPNKTEGLIRQILQAEQGRLLPLKKRWPLARIAAAVLIILGTGSYFLFFNKTSQKETARIQPAQVFPKRDVPPGGNKAVLTLANGSTIILDSAHNGMLAEQGNTQVLKTASGKISYQQSAAGQEVSAVQYNILTTPRGGQYQLILPDGSQVWLNAASSIKYPTAFTGNERKVEITGEAYFEVSKNAARPFKVKINDQAEVEVLGTHFDINAYDHDREIKTTLLEGSVKLSTVNHTLSSVLKPGQQANLQKNGELKTSSNVDIEEVVSWKDGYFHFNNAGLETVMLQISRWYDVDIVYEGKKPKEYFDGDIERTLNLSQVLGILQKSQVHFRVEGKKLVVMN